MKKLKYSFPGIVMSLFLPTVLSSCATLLSGTRAPIYLDGNVEEPLTITSSHGEYHDVTLPTMVEVKRHHIEGQRIKIESESHTYPDIVLEKTFNPTSILSCGNLCTLGVDLLTNAVSKPRNNSFYITCGQSDSLSSTDFISITPVEKKYLLPERYPRHIIGGGIGFGNNQADHDMHNMVDGYLKQYHLDPATDCFDLSGDSYLQTFLEYHYRLNRKWEIGGRLTWGRSGESYEYFPIDDNESAYFSGEQSNRFFVVAPSIRYTWHERYYYRFYSGVSMGFMRHHLTFECEKYQKRQDGQGNYQYPHIVTMENVDKIRYRMAYQLTAVGASVGGKWLHFFLDLGYGYLGVVNLGARVSF